METNNSQLVIYQTPQGDTRIDVRVKGDTIWLTQRQIAELFGTKVPIISKHLRNIFAFGELQEDIVISKMETTTLHGAIIRKCLHIRQFAEIQCGSQENFSKLAE